MQENNVEIVKAYYDQIALEAPGEAGIHMLSEDFKFIAGTAEIDRKAFIGMVKLLYNAVPDLKHTLSNIQVRGDVVQLTDHPTGTFTGAWDGTNYALPIIPPNGDPFHMAPTKWEITVRHGKITRWHDVTVPSAQSGLPGFLKALGSPLSGQKVRK